MTTDVPIATKVKRILNRRIGLPPEDIRDDARLVEDLEVDSLDRVELLIAAEREFDIALDEEAFRDVHTVEDVVAVIEQVLLAKSGGPR